ncbi:MAG: 2-oxo acid dehydrogenase subunit E2 [Actinomycetota bacterium]|nr:2-oxo acid dehydrogenase subunit E2 [Actinomycetota bacterium]
MATRDFLLPDLGEGLTEGEIVAWLVAVGDTVDVDQPVAEVETAKAVVEVPSPFAGTVSTLHGQVGEEVAVGTPLVTIEVGGGAAPAAAPAAGHALEEAEVAEMVPDVGADADADDAVADAGSGNVLVGYGTRGNRARRRAARPAAASDRSASRAETGPRRGGGPSRPSSGPSGRPRAKPPVRKLAKDLGVDLTQLSGSGPDGVITREDVRAYSGNGAQGATVPASEDYQDLLRQSGDSGRVTTTSAGAGQRIPVRGVRKAVAEKMTLSRREIPEAVTWVDVDATGLWQLRQSLNASQSDVKVSPLAIILRACVAGLRRYREINASLDTEANEIVLHDHVNLGFAAATDRGLVVPVIKGAEALSMLEIAAELNRLAAAAREGKITPDEMRAGTFTVSNYGSFGVDGGSAVINYPEAAILGVGRITDRPWVVDGELAVRKVTQLSIAFDHRICDGGEAGGFLRFIADCVEDPAVLLGAL